MVGSFVCRQLLENGFDIRAVKRNSSKMTLLKDIEKRIEWVVGDMNDTEFLEESLKNVDAVIHAAAIISFDKRWEQKMYQTNVLGTADLINACLKLKIQKFLHVSSVAAIGRKAGQIELRETDRWEGTEFDSIYARSKYLQELEVWRGAQEGLEVKIVNPSVILGPGLWGQGGSTSVFKYAYDEKPFHPAGTVNYVDVRDVASIIVKLLTSDIKDERFILNAGTLSYKDFFGKIAHAFGKKGPQKVAKPWMLSLAVVFEFIRSRITGNEAMITKDTAILSRSNFHFQNDKVREAINYEFRSLDDSIQWSVNELKEMHSL